MHATTVAVDLAKSVFQIAVADENWRVVETQRLTRSQFERWFINRSVGLVVMEACGSAHHWARWLGSLGIEVRLLPAQYVRAYVRRNKTDATDAAALLEAARASDLRPVRVKSVEQQALQWLHRIRSLWMGTRTSRINALRGFCREFGIAIPVGARTGVEAIGRVLAAPQSAVPEQIRHTASQLLEETVARICSASLCFPSRWRKRTMVLSSGIRPWHQGLQTPGRSAYQRMLLPSHDPSGPAALACASSWRSASGQGCFALWLERMP